MSRIALPTFLLVLTAAPFAPVLGATPNDPLLNRQWGWSKVGADRTYSAGLLGESVTVAVLDTGIGLNHLDLQGNVLPPCTSSTQLRCSKNFTSVDFSDVGDADGHGTMVSGVIAGIANNGAGIAGIAPRTKIMMLKVLTAHGGTSIDVDRAIAFALDSGVRVISMSLGGQSSRAAQLVDRTTALDPAQSRDAILIAAAGNDGTNENVYPAAYSLTYPNVFAVSALDQNNQKASFSNFGPDITFIAPGVNIVSTFSNGTFDGYAQGSGTSFSTPYVSAAVALLLSKSPNLSSTNIKQTLCSQAINLGLSRDFQGCGLIYVGNLVQLQTTSTTTSSTSTSSTTSSTTSTIPVPGQALVLVDVGPTDLQGNPRSSVVPGSQSQFKVTVSNLSPSPVTATLTVNVYDFSKHTLGVVFVQRSFSPGTSILIMSLSIPSTSSRGPATAYINVFDHLKGAPLSPEKSTPLQIG